jgi:hypothetical protein
VPSCLIDPDAICFAIPSVPVRAISAAIFSASIDFQMLPAVPLPISASVSLGNMASIMFCSSNASN